MLEQALIYAKEQYDAKLAQLIEWLSIPSISTLPEHQPAMQRAADWLVTYLRGIGMAHVEHIATPGHPVVYAEWQAADPAAPTLLIYGHYDVQPVDPLAEWRTPPFEPTIVGENIFARGASDDKGQIFALLAGLEAYLATAGRLPINVKVLVEGEEEISSPHLAPLIAERKAQLACDAVLIADHPLLAPGVPLVLIGVRGNCYMEVEVRGPASDLHSGTFGGAVENPLNVLVRLLASLQDSERRVTIPGFYDSVRPVSEAERALLARVPITEAAAMALSGAPALAGERGYSLAERLSVRPTFEVHGIYGGFTGAGKKTVIPAFGRAKIGMRLVPDQQPEQIAALVEAHLRRLAPPTVSLSVQVLGTSRAAVIDPAAPTIQATIPAYKAAFGAEPVLMRGGGSLPIVPDLQELLGAPIVMIGFGLPDDNLHAPNEKLNLDHFRRGMVMAIQYYAELLRL
jgi:acetylornithine deacetylase/succinyl-diaminopimelate desuccinylase-like protein